VHTNDSLEGISMPALEHVVGFMVIANNPMLGRACSARWSSPWRATKTRAGS
jgi:hypothetical protein